MSYPPSSSSGPSTLPAFRRTLRAQRLHDQEQRRRSYPPLVLVKVEHSHHHPHATQAPAAPSVPAAAAAVHTSASRHPVLPLSSVVASLAPPRGVKQENVSEALRFMESTEQQHPELFEEPVLPAMPPSTDPFAHFVVAWNGVDTGLTRVFSSIDQAYALCHAFAGPTRDFFARRVLNVLNDPSKMAFCLRWSTYSHYLTLMEQDTARLLAQCQAGQEEFPRLVQVSGESSPVTPPGMIRVLPRQASASAPWRG